MLKALCHNMENSNYCCLLKQAPFADGLVEMLKYLYNGTTKVAPEL